MLIATWFQCTITTLLSLLKRVFILLRWPTTLPSFKNDSLFLFDVSVLHSYIHICTYSMCALCKGALDLLGLELQMVVGHHVDVGNQTQVPYKSSQCSNHWTISPALTFSTLCGMCPYMFVCLCVCVGQRSMLEVILTLNYSHGIWNSQLTGWPVS